MKLGGYRLHGAIIVTSLSSEVGGTPLDVKILQMEKDRLAILEVRSGRTNLASGVLQTNLIESAV